ncbi:secretion system type I outer membrane efflux pump lipoprotein NodT [Neoasaia chiangmaiensis NBRC 101099]|uniref:Secretion protein n=1 Tax=Neoasaia chiangmaiensis TaxID=320497 RepID=A0A1U9KNT1_9PROT|nr:efflux transporter outer membrane subunit [Neoasaia chiangmaiensis]AQS87454.1 secretion protein [Neoasaia chiangmaiensis]GBR42659.1 secretion system type I outer membrane efflux pump lipoprotein NodT [Neoasaia chiangmaiensis NBRC 101099]GEN16236.1 multidrug MFS transporter [Neoasaia chiangmaiensis]
MGGFGKRALALLASASLLAGCTVGPNYTPDRMKLPDAFAETPHPATAAEIERTEAEMKEWWGQFHDPLLNRLVTLALKGNYDLLIADQHIIAERATREEAASAWYPQLDVNAGGGDGRYSINVDNWPLRPGNPANRPEASILTYGARASWEIDAFGRIRREVEATERGIDATIEARRATLVTLLSELAGDYMALRGTQLRLAIAEANVRNAQNEVDLTQKLYLEGVGNTLQTAQALAERDSEKATLEPLHTQLNKIAHTIGVLLGDMPGDLEQELERVPADPHGGVILPDMPRFPSALPSIVVANRPDIRQAERMYAEDTARIGVAVAQLYPHFTIPLNFNPNASALYQAFQVGAMSWSFMMLASLPVMHGGRFTSQVVEARAHAEASRLNYRRTILKAFKEVEDSMTAWQDDDNFVQELHRASIESEQAADRARRLYAAGLTDYLNVLTTQRTMLGAQDREAVARTARLRDAVDLYVAMGAGWQGQALRDTNLPIDAAKQSILAKAFSR